MFGTTVCEINKIKITSVEKNCKQLDLNVEMIPARVFSKNDVSYLFILIIAVVIIIQIYARVIPYVMLHTRPDVRVFRFVHEIPDFVSSVYGKKYRYVKRRAWCQVLDVGTYIIFIIRIIWLFGIGTTAADDKHITWYHTGAIWFR